MDFSVAAAGEWPGAVSAKFTDKFTSRPLCRRIVDTECRGGNATSLAQNGFGRYFTDRDGLVAPEGKRIIPPQQGEVCMWRPSKRVLSEPGSFHLEKPEGKQRIEPASSKVYSMPERRHIRQVESKEEYYDRSVGTKIVVRDNGLRAQDQPAREVDLQIELQRKVRPLDLSTQRNGITCRSLGDKCYRNPEYSMGFYKAGEIIVGSSFHRGMHSRTEPRNSTNIQLVIDSSKPPVKSYIEKLREQEVFEAQSEVVELTRQWERGTLKECDLTYAEPVDSDDEQPEAR